LSFPKMVVASVALLPVMTVQAATEWMSVNPNSTLLADAANGNKKRDGFFGTVSTGYLANTGNTDSASLNAKTSLAYIAAPWRHAAMLRAVKGSTNQTTTAEEYEAAEQTDYVYGDNNYVFGALNYARNRFSGYDRRVSEVIGYGRRLLDTDRHTLDLQAGAGARQTQLTDATGQNEKIVQVAAGYIFKLSDNAKFSQQLRAEKGPDNTYSESVTAVTSNLMGDLALSLSYTVKHNSDVPIDVEKTDTTTAVSLIYGF